MAETGGPETGSGANKARGRGGDVVVYLAMCVVAAAIGAGLFLQLGLQAWLALSTALALYVAMAGLHLASRRSSELTELNAEVRRLNSELTRLNRAAATRHETPRHEAARLDHARDHGRAEPVASAVRPEREPRIEMAQAGRAATVVTPAARLDEAAVGAPLAQQVQHAQQVPMQPSAVRPGAGPQSAPPTLPMPRAPQPAAQHQPPAAAAPVAASASSAAQPRQPQPQTPAQTRQAVTPPAALAGSAEPALAAPSPAASGVRDADVEKIQGLIKKLADEVNGGEAPVQRRPAPVTPPAGQPQPAPAAQQALTETAIETSLEVLRATAGSMRQATAPAAASPARPNIAPQEALSPTLQSPTLTVAMDHLPTAPRSMGHDPAPVLAPVAAPAAAARSVVEEWEEALSDGPDQARLAALREAITAGRVDVLLEPILGLVDQRPRHYQVHVRPKALSGEVFEDARAQREEFAGTGLLPMLDTARIARIAVIARRLADRGKENAIFSGFSGESLADDQFLQDFANAYHERDSFAGQLVLSFSQADVRQLSPRERSTLEDMRDLGFRFALTDVTDLDVDFEGLRAAGFQFVKLDADVFLEGLPASGGLIPASDICRYLAQLGLTLIVGDIADEAKFARIYGFGVLFGQGQLFGAPRLVKTEAAARGQTAAA